MRTALEQSVLAAIRHSRMLIPGDRVGVAVSGGADSVALLRILESFAGELGIALLVVHFDHSLRGEESDEDANFVAALARRSGLEFILEREDVGAAARKHAWNLEDAARRLRYGFFARLIEEKRATRIAVAHTADDQAETVLAHLIRGTGPAGLAGIYPVAGSVVRPLLEMRRQDLREYLRARGETWREDSTNRDQTRLRARVREQLLPVLERNFSTAIAGHLGNLARFAREEELFWTALVEDRLRIHSAASDEGIRIGIHNLLSPLPLGSAPVGVPQDSETPSPLRALTERLIRRLYEEVRGDRRELGARHVEQVIGLANGSSSGRQIVLPGGISVERVFDELIFSRAQVSKKSLAKKRTLTQTGAYQYVVSLPDHGATTVSIPELGSCFRLKVIDWPITASDTKRDAEALDADLLRTPLILRNWQPGDAYRPRGRRKPRKLKQMFLAERVPSRQRACWPVLESGGHVIWARGMPAAEEVCAREGTRVGVVIEEDRL